MDKRPHPEIVEGMRVAYSRKFLRSIGAYTGEMGFLRGTVLDIYSDGWPIGHKRCLCLVQWDGHPTPNPTRILDKNLWPADRLHLEPV